MTPFAPSTFPAMSRRSFLQAIAIGALAGSSFETVGRAVFGDVPDAWASPAAPTDGLLVVVTLFGGNDGLNTFVPRTDPAYYGLRGAVSIAPDAVLAVDEQHGIHPSAPYLADLYRAGLVAAVQGVGFPVPDLSHFATMAACMKGSFGDAGGTGWLGRWADGLGAGADLAAVSISGSVPLHLLGRLGRAVAVPETGSVYGAEQRPADLRLYDGLRAMAAAPSGRGAWHDTLAATMRRQLDTAVLVAPSLAMPSPTGIAAQRFAMAARLLNADIGLRTVDVSLDGFDHHEHQLAAHALRLADLDAGLQAFFATLDPRLAGRVTVLVVSEFGRAPASNASGGTDHGTANTLFVIGANVAGGTYGTAPSLTRLDANHRQVAEVDLRSLYGSVVDGWLGGGGSDIVGGPFEDLRLFRAGPGAAVSGAQIPIRVVLPSIASGYVPVQPVRVLDTREGTGGRSAPLGPGETWTLAFGGAADVPAGAVAVAMNVTSVDATARSFVTAWPAGAPRPSTANLNPTPGLAVPNLVVCRLGDRGDVSLYNHAGSVDLVADVVGWFSPASTLGIVALTPARVLDTRDGTGVGAPAPVGPGESIRVPVAGRGGAPERCSAVVVNVTVTEPTEPSFITTWPAGRPRPLAASLNMVPGQTVPNLVIAEVGTDGAISLYNHAGSTHLVADVLGAVVDGAPGRFVAVTPVRLLDTRDGTGAPAAAVGAAGLRVQIAGRGPVPWHGVTAVVLNMTAVAPTADTFVTVHPAGEPIPWAANLNVRAGEVVPNMVLARLGVDGAIDVRHHAGEVHLVADVMGYVIG